MSFPAILGVVSYSVTALLGTLAMRASGRKFWIHVALFFIGLAIWRITGAEDAVRMMLRDELAQRDLYASRRSIQAFFAGCIAIVGAGSSAFLWKRRKRLGRHGQARWWAEAAMLGIIALILIRLVSLSAIDRLLYGGPVHLNWFLEGGLVTICAIAAFRVWRRHG